MVPACDACSSVPQVTFFMDENNPFELLLNKLVNGLWIGYYLHCRPLLILAANDNQISDHVPGFMNLRPKIKIDL